MTGTAEREQTTGYEVIGYKVLDGRGPFYEVMLDAAKGTTRATDHDDEVPLEDEGEAVDALLGMLEETMEGVRDLRTRVAENLTARVWFSAYRLEYALRDEYAFLGRVLEDDTKLEMLDMDPATLRIVSDEVPPDMPDEELEAMILALTSEQARRAAGDSAS